MGISYEEPSGESGSDLTPIKNDVDWMLSTDNFIPPIIAYPSLLVDVNSSGSVAPAIISGTTPISGWRIVDGSLPPEFTLDAITGVISYNTSSITSSGSVTIVAYSPAGDGNMYTINWQIRESQGKSEFLNTLNKYPFMRISTPNSDDEQYLLKSNFYGRTTGTNNGTIIEDPAYPIYYAQNSDETWNYFIMPTGYSYWVLYIGCSTDPTALSNGLSTDISTSGAAEYNLVAPITNDVVVDGVKYPSDRSDIHWGSGVRFIDFGNDSTLDGFMTSASPWSYGFTLDEAWVNDGMGKGLFTRENRNWLAVAIGHSGTYSEMALGNGSTRTYDSAETTTIPSGGFPVGTKIRFTFDGTTLSMYANGIKYYDYSASYYWDGSSANALNLHFSNGITANVNLPLPATHYTKWQGLISRMWISNGVVETEDDTGTVYPPNTTHAWEFDEVVGSSFSPSVGTITAVGRNVIV